MQNHIWLIFISWPFLVSVLFLMFSQSYFFSFTFTNAGNLSHLGGQHLSPSANSSACQTQGSSSGLRKSTLCTLRHQAWGLISQVHMTYMRTYSRPTKINIIVYTSYLIISSILNSVVVSLLILLLSFVIQFFLLN